ncbi:MAG: hypothetical protein Q8P41_08025 [Pseudomonadota bacterium]|nr:hypothetical protein [Pseudomonadota bacterium]
MPPRTRPIGPLFSLLAAALAGCSDYDVTRNVSEDVFVQDDGNLTVDVLWIMDDSGTMSEEQSNVVANLGAFVGVLDGFGADWQVGVTTTNVEADGGALVAGVITAYVDGVAEAFAAAVDVGTSGSRDEQGLRAMELATSEPLLSGANAGLVRTGADLAVIVLSDEDDHSPGDVEAYEGHLAALKGEGRVRLSAVVGELPAGCASPYAAADPAERYLDVAVWSGGLTDSICRQDFSETMKQLALNAMGLSDTFALSQVPEPENLEVRRDGVLLHPRDENGWRYAPGPNAIILDGYAVPGPGEGLEVRYYAWQGDVEVVE